MCRVCNILHLHDRFYDTSAFVHEIDKIRSLVSQGDMTADTDKVPLSEITGNFRGYARYVVICSLCGQKYAVWIDTAENDGGLCLLK